MPASRNTEAPAGPCFVVDGRGDIDFNQGVDTNRKCTLYAYRRGYFDAMTAYDAAGRVWKAKGVELAWEFTRWRRILARTPFYDPIIEVRVVWGAPKETGIEPLRKAYEKAVGRDDDTLTQFVEREELIGRIRAAADIAEMVAVWEWASTDQE